MTENNTVFFFISISINEFGGKEGGSIIEPPPPTGWTVTTAVASFYGISSVIPYSSTTKIYSWCCHLTVFVFTASGSQ